MGVTDKSLATEKRRTKIAQQNGLPEGIVVDEATDNSGPFTWVKIGGGGFTGGDGTLHLDESIGAGEANEYLLLLTSNGTIRFAIQRDGDVTFTKTLQIPKNLNFAGANTRIEGNASSYITVHTHNGTERLRISTDGFHVVNDGSVFIAEKASAEGDVAGQGQLFVKDNAGTQELWFRDDAGTETQLV